VKREDLRSITVNGVHLSYVRLGRGQPVVFVHGIPTDYRAWDSQLGPFSSKYDVIAYSRRLAKPNQNPEDYENSSIENNSLDLVGLIQDLGISPVHLVGHSYGGFIAAYTAATRPEVLRTITLIEPAISTMILKNRKSFAQFFSLLLTSPSTAMSAAKFQRSSLDPSLNAFKRGDYEAALRLNVDGIINRKDALDSLSDPIRGMMRDNEKTVGELMAEPPPFGKDEAAKINVPTLLMHGSDSPKVLHTIVERLAEAIPKNQMVTVPGSAHFPHFEKPQEFNRILLDFMERNS
jgi:non-heme chloroperoxidase